MSDTTPTSLELQLPDELILEPLQFGEVSTPVAPIETSEQSTESLPVSEEQATRLEDLEAPQSPDVDLNDLRFAIPKVITDDPTDVEDTVASDVEQNSLAENAIRSEWAILWAARSAGGDHVPDPDFDWGDHPDKFEEFTKDLPEGYWSEFEDAVSLTHAEAMAKRLRLDFKMDQEIEAAGWKGDAARITAAVLDPTIIPLMIANPINTAALKGGRIARAIKLGVVGAGENVAIDSIIAVNDPRLEGSDLIYSALGGFAMGSAFGAFTKGGKPNLLDEENHAMGLAAERAQNEILHDAVDALSPNGSLSAAQANPAVRESLLNPTEEELLVSTIDAPKSANPLGVRMDSRGQVGTSDNSAARSMAADMFPDSVGMSDGSPNKFSAFDWLSYNMDMTNIQTARVIKEGVAKYLKTNEIKGFMNKRKAESAFSEEITAALRGFSNGVSDEAHAAAKVYREQFNKVFEIAKAAGVKGFEGLRHVENYVPRIYHGGKINKLVVRFGEPQVRALISKAIRSAHEDISNELSDKLAKAHLTTVRKATNDVDIHQARGLNGEDTVAMREILEGHGTFTPEEIDDILVKLDRPDTAGKHTRSKQRTLMDETTWMSIKDGQGIEATVRLTDLFENDISKLWGAYNRSVMGASAMARLGYKSVGEVEAHINKVHTIGLDEGLKTSRNNADKQNLEYMASAVMGRPIGARQQSISNLNASKYGKAMRFLRNLQFVTKMGEMGFAQISEMGNILGLMNMKVTLANVPGLRDIIHAARGQRLSSEYFQYMEDIFGAGTNTVRDQRSWRDEGVGSSYDTLEGNVEGVVDNVMETTKRAVLHLSLFNTTQNNLSKLAANGAAAQIIGMAHGTSKMFSKKRLASYGASEEDLNGILSEIRKHTKEIDGTYVSKRKFVDPADFDDPTLAEKYIFLVRRIGKAVVQENDAGMMHRVMGEPMAAAAIQFRSFMFGSVTNLLARGVHIRDINVLQQMAWGSFIAGLTWSGQTAINAVGKDDPKGYLKDRLTTEHIAKAAIARSPFGAAVPTAIDSAMWAGGQDPLFDYRSSGISHDILGGIASVDYANKAAGTPEAIRNLINKGTMSKAQARNMWSLIPLQNTIAGRWVLNYLSQDLPKRINN